MLGRYIRQIKLIEISDQYALNSDTTVELLASIIVHEAQHARLHRIGIGFEEESRNRVERICFTAEKVFGLRIPNGEMVIEDANYLLNCDLDGEWSDAAIREAQLKALDELGCPLWIQRVVKWRVNRKSHSRGNSVTARRLD